MWEEIKYVLHKTDWMKTFVGITFVLLFTFLVIWVIMKPIPEGNREIALFVAGEVAGVALTIASFYYGSSKGSQEKAEHLKSLTDKVKEKV